jgi:electron transfer flavoprotein alpha subunit
VSENEGVLFLAEHRGHGLARMSAELVTAGLRLADRMSAGLSALVVGDKTADHARELLDMGVQKVYVAADPVFSRYGPESYLALLTQICRELEPKVLLMGHTEIGRDLGPRLAFRLDVAFAPNCVAMEIGQESGHLQVTRPVFGGKAHGLFNLSGPAPHIVTVGPKVFEPALAGVDGRGEVVSLTPEIDPDTFRMSVIERVEDLAEGVRLEDAGIIVSGGRGVDTAEGFAQLRDLAALLGGCVGASRAPIDNGLIPSNLQVGLTGTVVSPNVYMAVAISGAAQHMAGCSSANTIIAINRDPEAPIFERAHFGAVADWRDILPPLTEKCRSMLS